MERVYFVILFLYFSMDGGKIVLEERYGLLNERRHVFFDGNDNVVIKRYYDSYYSR